MTEQNSIEHGDHGFIGIFGDDEQEQKVRLCLAENQDKIEELASRGVRVRYNATGEDDPYCSLEDSGSDGQIELIDEEDERYLRTCPGCFAGKTPGELVDLMN